MTSVSMVERSILYYLQSHNSTVIFVTISRTNRVAHLQVCVQVECSTDGMPIKMTPSYEVA